MTAVLAVLLTVCGWLGWWQWQRATEHAVVVQPDPPVPLTELLEPAANPNAVLGRQVSVTGMWLDAQPVVVWGREVDGVDAAFLVYPLRPQGTDATVAVVVGWRPAAELAQAPAPVMDPGVMTVHGYLRGSEAAGSSSAELPWAHSTGGMSPAQFAQWWPSPLYSALVVSDTGHEQWQALPPREPDYDVDFRSASYAIQWWVFGLFAAVIALRWLRDNGVHRPTPQEDLP